MRRLSPPALVILFLGILTAGSASGTTYYIAASGSDSNNGTSKTTPWLHAPGMPNCASTCAGVTPAAGDSYIFRGGDTWHRSASTSDSSDVPVGGQWTLSHSGNSTACGYLGYLSNSNTSCISFGGIDTTWYNSAVCGASFCKPIFNMDNPVWANSTHQDGSNPGFVTACTHDDSGLAGALITGSYLQVENWEIFGKCFQTSPGSEFKTNTGSNVGFIGLLVHGWTEVHVSSPNDFDQAPILGGTGGYTSNGNWIDLSVFDGYDTGPFTGSTPGCATNFLCTGGPISYNNIQYISHSVCRNMSNCFNPGAPSSVHDNIFCQDFESWDGSDHGGILEATGAPANTTQYVYNNIICDSQIGITYNPNLYGSSSGMDVALFLFNNVYFNVGNGANCVALANSATGANSPVNFFNNTFDDTNSFDVSSCTLRLTPGGAPADWQGTGTFQNNHFIAYAPQSLPTFTGSPGSGQTLVDNGNEVYQAESAANGQGYTPSNNYAPTSSSGATVGAGNNLTSLCSTIMDSNAAAACTAGFAGISYNTTTHVITVNTGNARPSSGAWDAGAYFFSTGSGSKPNPPTNLTVLVQ